MAYLVTVIESGHPSAIDTGRETDSDPARDVTRASYPLLVKETRFPCRVSFVVGGAFHRRPLQSASFHGALGDSPFLDTPRPPPREAFRFRFALTPPRRVAGRAPRSRKGCQTDIQDGIRPTRAGRRQNHVDAWWDPRRITRRASSTAQTKSAKASPYPRTDRWMPMRVRIGHEGREDDVATLAGRSRTSGRPDGGIGRVQSALPTPTPTPPSPTWRRHRLRTFALTVLVSALVVGVPSKTGEHDPSVQQLLEGPIPLASPSSSPAGNHV